MSKLHPFRTPEGRFWSWLVGSSLLVTAAWFFPPTTALIILGCVAASGLLLLTNAWGLFHFRVVAAAFPMVLKWSMGAALVSTLVAAVQIPNTVRTVMGWEVSNSTIVIGGVILLLVLTFLWAALGLSLAALGGWVGRHRTDPAGSARAAVKVWWTCAAAILAVLSALQLVPPLQVSAALFLCVLGFCWLTAADVRPHAPEWTPQLANLLREGSSLLVWTKRGRRVDLRGLALGSLAAVVTLVCAHGPVPLLQPLVNGSLESLLNLRNQPYVMSRSGNIAGDEGHPGSEWRRRIVIVDLDPVARREALTHNSEARLIARVLKKLQAYHPRRVVVPLPQLDSHWPHTELDRADAPALGEEISTRNRRDLPELTQALRRSPTAILAVPRLSPADLLPLIPTTEGPPKLSAEARIAIDALKVAAIKYGDSGLDWSGTTRIPAIRLGEAAGAEPQLPVNALQPIPVLLLNSIRGVRSARAVLQGDGVRLAGVRIPTSSEGIAFVDYGGADPDGFPRVAYSSVLNGAKVFDATPQSGEMMAPPVGWRTAADYFADKIVLLQPISEPSSETPVGRLTSTELMAEATATLASGRFVRSVSPKTALLGLLLLCAVAGQSCVGLAPLLAGVRIAFGGLFVLLLAPILIFNGVWLDPVSPLFGLVITYALVTQITFTLEQDERRRQRGLLDRVASPQVVEELLDRSDQLALGGERRQVCILFADVRNFTPFAESHSAEKVIEVINHYTTALTEALLEHEGILDRYTGDGLVARFDVLHSPEEDVTRAVVAALAMRDAAEALAEQMRLEGEPELRIGLGMHFGEAVVGLVGSPTQFHYTAMGHAVVVAARLQGFAEGGEVLISDAVYALVAPAFQCEAREPMWLKGISEPVQTYRVLTRRLPDHLREPATAANGE